MSQNELQRVVAEMRDHTSRDDRGRCNGMASCAELDDWASRIEAAQAVAPGGGEWPDYVMLRDTKLHDDQGGLGQRIFTTAGAGYKKVKYVRADIAAAPASEAKGINGEALVERLEMLVVALKAEASVGRRGYNFGEDAANARAGSIAEEIEKAVHEVRVLGTSHPRTAEEAHRCKGASEPKPAASSAADIVDAVDDPHGECPTCHQPLHVEQEHAGETPSGSRESRMVVVERDSTGKPTVWCDPEIVDLVTALNAAGIRTVASCSGHGQQNGNIALADGRELFIVPSFDVARECEAALLRRAARVEVTDAMEERAFAVWKENVRTGDLTNRACIRAALTAALEPKE